MRIDYSKDEYHQTRPDLVEQYRKLREANDQCVLNVAKALGKVMEIVAIEGRGYDGRYYTVEAKDITFNFHVEIKHGKARLEVFANYQDLGLTVQVHELCDLRQPDSASMDLARDPVKIAAEILRKVVPGYNQNVALMTARDEQRTSAAKKRNETAEKIAKALGTKISGAGGGHFKGLSEVGAQDMLTIYCPAEVPGYRFYVSPGGGATLERVSLSDPDKAVKLAEFLVTLKGGA